MFCGPSFDDFPSVVAVLPLQDVEKMDLDISKVLDEFLTPKMDDFLEKYEDVIRFLI
jgi:hypothetical protein